VDTSHLWQTAAIGIVGFAFAFICIIGAGPDTALKGFAGLLLGLPVFVWLQRSRSAREPVSVSDH
jgi:hypothetical protein